MASTYTLEHVEGQGVCFGVYGSRPQPRVDPHKRKLHPATVASMRLQSAILERRNPEFVDNYCEQANALIQAVGGCSEQNVGKQNATRRPVVQLPSVRFLTFGVTSPYTSGLLQDRRPSLETRTDNIRRVHWQEGTTEKSHELSHFCDGRRFFAPCSLGRRVSNEATSRS